MYSKTRMHSKGLTLIELLMAITLTGVISVIFFTMVPQFTKRAHDVQRKKDLKVWQEAIEQYYVDKGVYPWHMTELSHPDYPCTPPACSICTGWCANDKDSTGVNWQQFELEISPYLKEVPRGRNSEAWVTYVYTTSVRDPSFPGGWTYEGPPVRYCIGTFLETPNDPQINNPTASPNGSWNLECDKFQWGCASNYYLCGPKEAGE